MQAKHQSVLDRVRDAQAAIAQKHASIAALSNDVTHLQRQIEACERSALEQDERKIVSGMHATSHAWITIPAAAPLTGYWCCACRPWVRTTTAWRPSARRPPPGWPSCSGSTARWVARHAAVTHAHGRCIASLPRTRCCRLPLQATAASEQARGQLASATTALRDLDMTTGSLAAQLDSIRAEHARMMQQVADVTALLDERRSTHESLSLQVKEGAAAVAAAKTRVVEADTQKHDLERLVEEAQGALKAVQAEYEHEKARRSALLAAVEIASAQLHASTKATKAAAADLADMRSMPLPKLPAASQDSVRPASARGAGGRAAEAYSRRPAKRPRVEESFASHGSDSGDDDVPLVAAAAVAAVPVSAARSRLPLQASLHSTDDEGDDADGGAASPHTPPRASQLSLSQASAAMRQASDARVASAAPATARLSGAAPTGAAAPAAKSSRSLFVFERYAHPAFLFHGGAAPAAKAGR